MTGSDDHSIDRRAVRLGALLAATDVATPALAYPREQIAAAARRQTLRRWRIAALITLLVAGAAGVPPVRAWIVGTVRAWLGADTDTAAASGAAPVPAPATAMGSVGFSAGDPFTIHVASRQAAGGALLIVAGEDSSATATIIGQRDGAELLVQPSALRIANTGASTAGYVVTLPAGLRRVSVQVGSDSVRQVTFRAAGERVIVDLSSEPRAPAR